MSNACSVSTPASPRASRQLATLIAMYASMQILRFGSNLLLTRLVAPDILGVMALMTVVMQGLQMLSDTGVGVCIVQSRRGEEPAFLQTAWTIQIVRGFGLWMIGALLAWPAAVFFNDSRIAVYLPVLGAAAAIQGCNSIMIFAMNRRLAMGRVLLLELMSYALSLAVTLLVIWSTQTTSAWPLVGFNLASTALFMALTHLMLPAFPHRLRRDPESVRELTHFGRWIFASTCCAFLANQADRLWVGKLLSVSGLGLYHVAAMVAGLPTLLMASLSAHYLVPQLSRVRNQGGDASAAFQKSHRLGMLAAWLMTAGLLAFGADAVQFLYRGPYLEIIELLPILIWISWFQMLQTLGNAWILSQGRAAHSAAANVGKLVAMIFCAWIGWTLAGMTGLLLGFLAAELVRYAITNALAFHRMPAVWMEQLVATFCLVAAFLAFRSIGGRDVTLAAALSKCVAAGALLTLACALIFWFSSLLRRGGVRALEGSVSS